MIAIIASAILAASIAQAEPCECKPLPTFALTANDGFTYTQQSLVKKPTVLVFLNGACPHTEKAAPDLNRLKGMFGKNVGFVGITNGTPDQAKSLAKSLKFKFPVLADPNGKVIESFGARHSLDFALVCAEDKKVAKTWEGLSRSIVAEILNEVGNHGGPRIKANLDAFSASRLSGCGF